MTIPVPSIEWPLTFRPTGPAEDPDIVLTADARLEDAAFVVMAVRLRQGRKLPDYKEGVPGKAYGRVDWMVEVLEDLVDMAPQTVSIGGAKYLLWMVPAAAD